MKYYSIDNGGFDFIGYYPIDRQPWNFHAGNSPFIYRQISASLTFLFWKLHLFYVPKGSWPVRAGMDPNVLYAAVTVNWLCLVNTAVVTSFAAESMKRFASCAWPLLAGLLCFLQMLTQQVVITGLTEGPSWLLIAAGLYFYLRRWIVPLGAVIALSILQRELVALIFAAITVALAIRDATDRRWHLTVLAISSTAICAYLLMRGITAPSRTYEFQLSPASFFEFLSNTTRVTNRNFLMQGLLSQNLIAVWGIAWLANRRSRETRITDWSLAAGTAIVALVFVCLGALSAINNTGRLLALLTPLIATLIAAEGDAATRPDATADRVQAS